MPSSRRDKKRSLRRRLTAYLGYIHCAGRLLSRERIGLGARVTHLTLQQRNQSTHMPDGNNTRLRQVPHFRRIALRHIYLLYTAFAGHQTCIQHARDWAYCAVQS